MTPAIIIIGIILIALVAIYNSLVAKKNKVEYALSSTDVMLKKRHDLIPNLIAVVKQYMNHEGDLLKKIVGLRNQVTTASSKQEQYKLEGQLSQAMGQMRITMENYPDLKSHHNFDQLQRAMNEAEEQISAARRTFNDAVYHYNTAIESFPVNMIAGMFGHTVIPSFELLESERGDIDVDKLFK